MPYFVFRIEAGPLPAARLIGEHARFADASRQAKSERASGVADGAAVRLVYAENALAAEALLLTPRPPAPRTGEDV